MAADGEPILGSLYVYAPNKAAPIVFTVAYGLSAVGHIWQCYYHKAWKMIGLHPLCAVLFTAGYALREYGAHNYLYEYNNTTLIIFVVSQVLIYVCPPLLELSNYHVLGRLLYYVPYFAPLPPGKVLSTFAALMILVETLNALGVTLNTNPSASKSQQDMGSHLTVAALALQLAIIIIFICLAGLFHRRCARAKIRSRPVTTILITMYVSMILILVRCIYRLVEHTGGTAIDITDMEKLRNLSPILRYEYYFYIFESTLMLLNSILWNVWNPGRFLPENYLIHLAEDGSREIEEDFKDDRTLLKKTTHVLTFGVLFGKKVKHRRLHELNDYEESSS